MSQLIDRCLEAERKAVLKAARDEIKVLLLGSGESGKSTFLKQLRFIYRVDFTDGELAQFRNQIRRNAMQCIKDLIGAMDFLKIPYGFDAGTATRGSRDTLTSESEFKFNTGSKASSAYGYRISGGSTEFGMFHMDSLDSLVFGTPARKKGNDNDPCAESATLQYLRVGGQDGQQGNGPYAAKFLGTLELNFEEQVPDVVMDAVKTVWWDSGVQYCFTRGNEFHLMDCCAHYLDNFDRIFHADYIPSKEDILYTRETTQTLHELSFKLEESVIFRIYDLGGQRNQRKQWESYFDKFIKLIFHVVSISSFDQVLFEDESVNRVRDALNLFAYVCNHPIFKKTPIILLMNKVDLFKRKLRTKQLSTYFREYTGKNDYEGACEFFVKLFSNVNKYKEKAIYIHFISATDTKQIAKIMKSVSLVIVQDGLKLTAL